MFRFSITAFLLFVLGAAATAAAPEYVTLRLPFGLEVDAPADWQVGGPDGKPGETVRNAPLDLSKAELAEGAPGMLFAAGAPANVPPALFTITVVEADEKDAKLATMTPEKLTELGAFLRGTLERAHESRGGKLIDFAPLERIEVGGHYGLRIKSSGAMPNREATTMWITQVVVGSKKIGIFMTYPESSAGGIEPVIAHIAKSIRMAAGD